MFMYLNRGQKKKEFRQFYPTIIPSCMKVSINCLELNACQVPILGYRGRGYSIFLNFVTPFLNEYDPIHSAETKN